jgi:hypothetical protein
MSVLPTDTYLWVWYHLCTDWLCCVQGMFMLTVMVLHEVSNLAQVAGLQGCPSLQVVRLQCCRKLACLDLHGTTALEELIVTHCYALRALNVSGLAALERLEVSYCDALQKVDGLDALGALRQLYMASCEALQFVHLGGSPALEQLDIIWCRQLLVVDLRTATALKRARIAGCRGLWGQAVPAGLAAVLQRHLSYDGGTRPFWNQPDSPHKRSDWKVLGAFNLQYSGRDVHVLLEMLDMMAGTTRLGLLGLEAATALQTLHLDDCASLHEVLDVGQLTALERLHLAGCKGLRQVVGLELLGKVTELAVDAEGMKEFKPPGLSGLAAVESLEIRKWTELQSLDLQAMAALSSLDIAYCRTS